MKKILFFISACIAFVITSCEKDDLASIYVPPVEQYKPVAVNKTNGMKLYVHYMPWFETTESSDKWGQHWTMANKDPNKVDANGKREIASHFYPLIGPYASSDSAVIQYHLLLMKYSGIDGILIDWYGTRDKYDYAANKKNTEAIVPFLEKAGLEFAIVYEDQTLRGDLEESERPAQAKADMKYLNDNFFKKSNYIKIDGKPLLMVFGPQIITSPAVWTDVFSNVNPKPTFVTLYNHSQAANDADNKNAAGEYIWVDATSMETKYASKNKFDVFIGGAYPGFKDYYKEGGWGNQVLAPIDYQNGALFKNLLQMAKTNNMSYLQLITWNDFGEGTMIEPTNEFGYKFLNEIQTFAGVSYDSKVLESIYEFYKLRKDYQGKSKVQRKITQVFYYLVSLKVEEADALMKEIRITHPLED